MSSDLIRVGNFLAHYASEFYDPQKAHEYYLKTRELKGRESTKGMSDAQKEGWTYAKSQIADRKKTDIKSAEDARQAFLAQARATAQAAREQISAKLQSLMQTISDQESAEAEKITSGQKDALEKLIADQKTKSASIREDAAQQIAALPPIPKGASDEQRAKLAADRAQKIAEIQGKAWDDLVSLSDKGKADHDAVISDTETKRAALTESTKNQRTQARAEATSSRDVLSTGLKATVDKARADYDARKEQIKADYEAAAQREYDALKSNLPSAPAKEKKGKKAKNQVTVKPGTKVMTLQEAAEDTVRRLKTS